MHNLINTGKFLLQHQFNKFFPVFSYSLNDPASGMNFVIYEPEANDNKRHECRGTILTFHGMTMLGSMDQRFINACRSLAGCGYTVVAVQMDSMQNLLIHDSIVEETVKIISAVADNREICPSGKVSIFAASFAGGICMIASSDKRISDKISSICLIGSFSDIETSIRYLLSAQESDSYGRLIILKNFLKYSFDVPASVGKAIDIALADNFYEREKAELPSFLNSLSLSNYDLIRRLLEDPYFRIYHWNRIKKNEYIQGLIDRFSARNYLKKTNASIVIIHGVSDNVIPVFESIRLYNELQRLKVKSKLILTPLMGHSDVKLSLNLLPSVIDLFKGLSGFFGYV